MNRLLDYQRGVLASGGGSVSTPIALPDTNQEQAYNLDGLGNWSTTTITPEGGSSAVQSRTHNKLNEVTVYGGTSVLYDHGNNSGSGASRGNGNIVNDGLRTYAFDAFNRLTTVGRVSDGATIGQYTYDAMGRRVQKIVSNGGLSGDIDDATTRSLYDGDQAIEDLNGSGETGRQFIWGQYIDELVQLKTYASGTLPAGEYYLLADLLYRSTALTDASADIQEAYDTDAYGNTLAYSGPGADDAWFTNDDVQTDQPLCEYIFTGRHRDPETQIYWYRARYYQPQLGRFIGRDPIGYGGGVNLYLYLDSNPLRGTDPFGNDSGFWEFLRCYDACLQNNDIPLALSRWVLTGLAGGIISWNLLSKIGIDKDTLASFAQDVLKDEELADQLRGAKRIIGMNPKGSLQNFGKVALRDQEGALEFLQKFGKVAKIAAAVQAVADLAIHTHCIAMCCVLSSNNLRYGPSQDDFIGDWLSYHTGWIEQLYDDLP